MTHDAFLAAGWPLGASTGLDASKAGLAWLSLGTSSPLPLIFIGSTRFAPARRDCAA